VYAIAITRPAKNDSKPSQGSGFCNRRKLGENESVASPNSLKWLVEAAGVEPASVQQWSGFRASRYTSATLALNYLIFRHIHNQRINPFIRLGILPKKLAY
jgi:hypothetical protein